MLNIGVFDSGIGGLTVLSELKNSLSCAKYIYYADTKHMPYGKKTPDQISNYMTNVMDFFVNHCQADLVLLACNTATSVSAANLRKKYSVPIVGMEPAIKPAIEVSGKYQNVVVTATNLTLQQKKLISLIESLSASDRVEKVSLQELVIFAENGEFKGEHVLGYIKKQFEDIDFNLVDALVLGCTHFIYYYSIIRSLVSPHVQIVDGNMGTVNRVISLLGEKVVVPENIKELIPSIDYYVSGEEANQKQLDFFKECLYYADSILYSKKG